MSRQGIYLRWSRLDCLLGYRRHDLPIEWNRLGTGRRHWNTHRRPDQHSRFDLRWKCLLDWGTRQHCFQFGYFQSRLRLHHTIESGQLGRHRPHSNRRSQAIQHQGPTIHHRRNRCIRDGHIENLPISLGNRRNGHSFAHRQPSRHRCPSIAFGQAGKYRCS